MSPPPGGAGRGVTRRAASFGEQNLHGIGRAGRVPGSRAATLEPFSRVKTGTLTVSTIQVRANGFDLLSRLADDLAHEIKNPIHAAVINVELIRRRIASDDDEQALERAHLLEAEVVRAHRLVDGLLRLLRPAREPPQVFEIDQVVAGLQPLLQAIARVNRVELLCEPAGSGAQVRASLATIRHAFLNLFVNALDAVVPGGGRIEISAAWHAGVVRLVVADTGPGLSADAVAQIGTPGFTTRPGRPGLGLAVAQALLDEAGGRVECASPGGDDGGAAFVLCLPRVGGA